MITSIKARDILKNTKTKIVYVPTKGMYGYVGMNDEAAKDMGFPWHNGKHCILIDKNLDPLQKRKTVAHEVIEEYEMRHGKKYWPAHRDATVAEKFIHGHKKPRKFKEYIY
jgi:hypothetical protein